MPFHSLPPFTAPALIARHGLSSLLTPDGELLDLPAPAMRETLRDFPPPLLVHGPATLRLLEMPPVAQPVPWFDLLELFLFIHPAVSVTPTPLGLASALDLPAPEPLYADLLPRLCTLLLSRLQALAATEKAAERRALLAVLSEAGWAWGETVAAVLGPPERKKGTVPCDAPYDALRVWKTLPQWQETAPRPAPGSRPVAPRSARERLHRLLGENAETRPGQEDFACAVTTAFEPRDLPNAPHIVLAEAGTGTGKTLGYIAPASLWAEENGGAVWISTYTRHLQRQIEQEMRRLHPDRQKRLDKVVVRKGRENYLCLLNMEDTLNAALSRRDKRTTALIPLVFLALWAKISADGDLLGGDLPGWFGEIFSPSLLYGVADRRGECIHAACPHYQSCFIEHGIRRARQADLVVANHALVMAQAAWNALAPADLPDENGVPTRYVFDEGHHIPDAADQAFSLILSGLETAELRRWLLGAEGSRSRARGLRRRFDDLIERLPALDRLLDAVLRAARHLPAPGWSTRLHDAAQEKPEENVPARTDAANGPEDTPQDAPIAPIAAEAFLTALHDQLRARRTADERAQAMPSTECDLHPASPSLMETAGHFATHLGELALPLEQIIAALTSHLQENDEIEAALRQRMEAMIRVLHRRAVSRIRGWISMLDTLKTPPEDGARPLYIDFIRSDLLPFSRAAQERLDIGLHRHWLDPTLPFASTLQSPAHGLLMTSATLRDSSDELREEESWQAAESRLGATHFLRPPLRVSVMSPFDYAEQTRAYVITDVSGEIPSLAQAFQKLFVAADGGALGLFTAIRRLRAVHERIHEALGLAGLSLYAQHVDAMDNATLVDIFRTEIQSCLLGTDAMRDGVDIPGEALRMVVFERTPWPRPDILHRERRRFLSEGRPGEYDDRITRMRLRQAFGRLIRRSDDRGVFVMLDRRMPSRLFSAFPKGVTIRRLGLTDASAEIRDFLGTAPETERSDA